MCIQYTLAQMDLCSTYIHEPWTYDTRQDIYIPGRDIYLLVYCYSYNYRVLVNKSSFPIKTVIDTQHYVVLYTK